MKRNPICHIHHTKTPLTTFTLVQHINITFLNFSRSCNNDKIFKTTNALSFWNRRVFPTRRKHRWLCVYMYVLMVVRGYHVPRNKGLLFILGSHNKGIIQLIKEPLCMWCWDVKFDSTMQLLIKIKVLMKGGTYKMKKTHTTTDHFYLFVGFSNFLIMSSKFEYRLLQFFI